MTQELTIDQQADAEIELIKAFPVDSACCDNWLGRSHLTDMYINKKEKPDGCVMERYAAYHGLMYHVTRGVGNTVENFPKYCWKLGAARHLGVEYGYLENIATLNDHGLINEAWAQLRTLIKRRICAAVRDTATTAA